MTAQRHCFGGAEPEKTEMPPPQKTAFKQEMIEYGKGSGKYFRSFFVREEKKSKGLYCEEKQDMLYYRGKRRSCLGKIAAAVSSQVKIF